jgi:hypothetical protein
LVDLTETGLIDSVKMKIQLIDKMTAQLSELHRHENSRDFSAIYSDFIKSKDDIELTLK